MIYFTSDHHFSHINIIRYCKRPFADIHEMNAVMLQRWNEVVQPDDTVFYLGDFAMARPALEEILPRLNGEKHLIMGNHDLCHPCHKKKSKPAESLYRSSGFQSIALEMTMEIAGQSVLLSHMPYLSGDANHPYENKHREYRPKNLGNWLLCGHIHEKWKQLDRMINVGVDVWDFYPVSFNEIEKIITSKT